MAQSTLIVYNSIEATRDGKRSYWEKYIDFYEQYWGGPMSPFGIWFGNEYDNFRRAIAGNLSISEESVQDCFFIRDRDGLLYVCPLGASGENGGNILSCEDMVPFEWLAAFDEQGRHNFYSHWGFSSIHYNAKVGEATERIGAAADTVMRAFEKTNHEKLRVMVEWMGNGIRSMDRWFSGRDDSGYAVLNYGDVCSVLSPQYLDAERSVERAGEIMRLLDAGKWDKSYGLALRLLRRWEDLKQMCAIAGDRKPLQ